MSRRRIGRRQILHLHVISCWLLNILGLRFTPCRHMRQRVRVEVASTSFLRHRRWYSRTIERRNLWDMRLRLGDWRDWWDRRIIHRCSNRCRLSSNNGIRVVVFDIRFIPLWFIAISSTPAARATRSDAVRATAANTGSAAHATEYTPENRKKEQRSNDNGGNNWPFAVILLHASMPA